MNKKLTLNFIYLITNIFFTHSLSSGGTPKPIEKTQIQPIRISEAVQDQLVDAILNEKCEVIKALGAQHPNIAKAVLIFPAQRYVTYPIFIAIKHEKLIAIMQLLKLGADIQTIFQREYEGLFMAPDSAVTYAIRKAVTETHNYTIVELLLSWLAQQVSTFFPLTIYSEKSQSMVSLLEYAIMYKDIGLVQRLLLENIIGKIDIILKQEPVTSEPSHTPQPFVIFKIQAPTPTIKIVSDKETLTEPRSVSDQATQVDSIDFAKISYDMGILASRLIALEQEILKLKGT